MIRISALFLAILLFSAVGAVSAQTVDELRSKIDSKTTEIKNLEAEIAQYQKELDAVGAEKNTLENEVRAIDLTIKKLATDIRVTESKITSTNLNIQKLTQDIGGKVQDIARSNEAIKDSIRKQHLLEGFTLAELALQSANISDFWDEAQHYAHFQTRMTEAVNVLQNTKVELEGDKKEVEAERAELLRLKTKLSDQKRIEDGNKAARNQILTQTKNKEAEYQKILTEKQRLKQEFEDDLFNFESQLRTAIDPNSLPPVGAGVLSWPLDKVYVTQKFGNTAFARSGGYNGQGHNGIDFRASVGTEVKAARSGTVWATGNSDLYRGCYSYGQWVLIKHENGLTTLYAHLSLIKVSPGQQVRTGQLIGYSGRSGYVTGPHLHFGVYATQGVQLIRYGDKNPSSLCARATLPVASFNAYLDPLLYL